MEREESKYIGVSLPLLLGWRQWVHVQYTCTLYMYL